MAFLGRPSFSFTFITTTHQAIEETMIKRTIKIIKKLDEKVTPAIPPVRVYAVLGESEVRNDNATAVNKWISERRENDRIEKADSTGRIQAWRKLHSLEVKGS